MGKKVNLEGENAYENRGNIIQQVEGVVVNSQPGPSPRGINQEYSYVQLEWEKQQGDQNMLYTDETV